MNMNNYHKFDVLSKNVVVAHVSVIGNNVQIQKENVPIALQPFKRENCTIIDVYNFLKDRCFDDNREDLKEILESVGLTSNNPWEWNKISHGITADDFWWIRWDGETLSWEDVAWKK